MKLLTVTTSFSLPTGFNTNASTFYKGTKLALVDGNIHSVSKKHGVSKTPLFLKSFSDFEQNLNTVISNTVETIE